MSAATRSEADPPAPRNWEHGMTQRVGSNVRRHRKARGLSILALAAATAAQGHEMNRMAIGNLENGHRETVTLGEILTLARALDVPPRDLAPELDMHGIDAVDELRARASEVVTAAAALSRWLKGHP